MAITTASRAACDSLDGLDDRLGTPGSTFLDVGTGTGWLAIATARTFPEVRVTGIDIFEPALHLARQNVVGKGMQDRVDLKEQNAVDITEEAIYDVIWLPLPFMPGGDRSPSGRCVHSGASPWRVAASRHVRRPGRSPFADARRLADRALGRPPVATT